MAKIVGIVGKPNCGKSTFFNACTLAHAEIANYPFTTIKPNRGVAYVKVPCPCKEFNVKCNPQNSTCKDGERFIPIEMLDVAGLVPGAHLGKGIGNQFLDDLRQAHGLIHIVDASGSTDENGKQCEPGTHNPLRDVKFLEQEIDLWFVALLEKDWAKMMREIDAGHKDSHKEVAKRLSGFSIEERQVVLAMKEAGLGLESFAKSIRKIAKPIIVCANKCDLKESEKFLESLKQVGAIPASADSELALRRAAEKELIDYTPGNSDFAVKEISGITEQQKNALESIRKNVLQKFGSTGVQHVINKAVFEVLNLIVTYPVEDENKFTDKHGNVLPDAHLVPRGTTCKELAYRVHTEIGEKFICAIDARTKRRLGAEHVLKENDIIRIVHQK